MICKKNTLHYTSASCEHINLVEDGNRLKKQQVVLQKCSEEANVCTTRIETTGILRQASKVSTNDVVETVTS